MLIFQYRYIKIYKTYLLTKKSSFNFHDLNFHPV